MTEVVDAFTHVLPRRAHEALHRAHPTEALRDLAEATHLWDVEKRLADMDDLGVDRQVLTLVRPPIWDGLDPAAARGVVATANDVVADYAAGHPDRFLPVATVPYPTAGYVDELERCVTDRGMVGVQLFSNVGGRPIDHEAHRPFFAAVADLEVPIWLHPQLHDWYAWIGEDKVDKVLGWPFDTSVAAMRLVLGGVLEAHPDLRVITHHLGGMLPFFAGRIEMSYEARRRYDDGEPVDRPELSRPIPAYFEQLYGDTAIGASAPALECGRAFFGDDRVVLGSDYPMGPEGGRTYVEGALEIIDAADAPAARRGMRGGNLLELLDR